MFCKKKKKNKTETLNSGTPCFSKSTGERLHFFFTESWIPRFFFFFWPSVKNKVALRHYCKSIDAVIDVEYICNRFNVKHKLSTISILKFILKFLF